jgi:hypothetical protein
MPKNILDTLIAVGGISGEYEALTEAEIAAVPGAAYTPPEQFESFRVVAARTVQLLGGAPWFVKTFQTSDCTLRVPSGNPANNDATDGRVFFVKNDLTATGDVTIETSGATVITTLTPGDSIILLHEDNDAWEAKYAVDFIPYRYSNSNGVPVAGIRFYRSGQGVRVSSCGDTIPYATVLKSISSAVATADTARTYDVDVVLDPSGTPTILATLTIDGNNGRFEQVNGLAVSIPANSEIGIQVVLATGAGASSFNDHNVSIMLERV